MRLRISNFYVSNRINNSKWRENSKTRINGKGNTRGAFQIWAPQTIGIAQSALNFRRRCLRDNLYKSPQNEKLLFYARIIIFGENFLNSTKEPERKRKSIYIAINVHRISGFVAFEFPSLMNVCAIHPSFFVLTSKILP